MKTISLTQSIGSRLRRRLIIEKLNNPIGYLAGTVLAGVVALMFYVLGVEISALLVGALIAVPVVVACIFQLEFGLIVMISAGFMIGLVSKYTGAPIGTALDGLLYAMSFGVIVKLGRERDFSAFKNPIGFFILLWIWYNILQVLNPGAGSRMAWVYTVRSMALMLVLFYVASYGLNSLAKVKLVIKVIVGWAFVSALYSLKQEWIGFSNAELAWLYADEKRFQLIFQWNRLRVFSLFSDPTTFGILMGYMGVFCGILATGPFKLSKRIWLGIAAGSMILGMAYAGSRTPFVMVPIGIVFYTIMTFKRQTLIALGIFAVLGTGMVLKSTSNAVIWRIQSAFKPSTDASVQVRLDNQALIQPYIQQHPLGAGLGSTGMWGERFTPNSWLAGFAHDSLYVRIGVETGYIGLLIYMAMLFVAMRTGFYYYFRCKDPTIKILYCAITTAVILLALASYPQEAITLLPTSIVFYIFLAMLVRLKDFDPAFQREVAPTKVN